jgi:hypothetical protein
MSDFTSIQEPLETPIFEARGAQKETLTSHIIAILV